MRGLDYPREGTKPTRDTGIADGRHAFTIRAIVFLMADPEHLLTLEEGPKAWNRWRARVNLVFADLRWAHLANADLRKANLAKADLGGADLSGADLSDADLLGANLAGANLRTADFRGTVLGETIFGASDLSEAKGLDTCIHVGPSIIDHWTLSMSGSLPPPFSEVVAFPMRSLLSYHRF